MHFHRDFCLLVMVFFLFYLTHCRSMNFIVYHITTTGITSTAPKIVFINKNSVLVFTFFFFSVTHIQIMVCLPTSHTQTHSHRHKHAYFYACVCMRFLCADVCFVYSYTCNACIRISYFFFFRQSVALFIATCHSIE